MDIEIAWMVAARVSLVLGFGCRGDILVHLTDFFRRLGNPCALFPGWPHRYWFHGNVLAFGLSGDSGFTVPYFFWGAGWRTLIDTDVSVNGLFFEVSLMFEPVLPFLSFFFVILTTGTTEAAAGMTVARGAAGMSDCADGLGSTDRG
ncbi:hypothetical protein JB92DRAFT_3043027, partial [Gautieria morchelliformis]